MLKRIADEAKRQGARWVLVREYEVDVTRDGRFWLVEVPGVGRSTQALRLKDVRVMAAELVEVMTGALPGDYELLVEVTLPDAVRAHLARAEVLRAEAARKQAESRAAVRELLAEGLSQREAGEVLGLSYQRVSQLAGG